MQMKRVVITGMGVVSPFGIGVEKLMKNVIEGNSAVVNMRDKWESDLPDLTCWVGAPVTEDLKEKSIQRKFRRSMGRTAILSALASREAVEQAGLSQQELSSGKTGISFASTTGSVESMEEFFENFLVKHNVTQMSSGTFFKVMSHTSASNLAHLFNIKGRVLSPDCACASSSVAIGLGYETIRSGVQDVMICGGSDELSVTTSAAFESVKALSFHYNKTPSKTPRPFDKDRDGTVCGEGAGCIILESLESARCRNALVLGEIIGFATLSDGTYIAQAQPESIYSCIKMAIESACIKADNVDYINAHATGTVIGDKAEALAIKEIFPEGKVPTSGFKGHIGHTMGASGVLESIICLKMLDLDLIFPSLNLDEPDKDCEGILHVLEIQKKRVDTIVKNSFAFGGINSVLIFRRIS